MRCIVISLFAKTIPDTVFAVFDTVFCGQQCIAAPDLLVLADERGRPVHNADIRTHTGSRMFIIAIPAQGYWVDKKNRKLWSI